MKWQWLILGGLIALTILSPLFGIIALAVFVHWRFREFFWRLKMAWLMFLLVLVAGIYLFSGLNAVFSWLLK